MPTHLSWKPINFVRWNNLAVVLGEVGNATTASLSNAILGMRVSWERMAEDLNQLFLPSGPPGTHAAHHFHGPPDPAVREEVLAAVVADYESSLMYLDVALQLSVKYLHGAAGQPYQDWKSLFKAAEQGKPGLAADAHDTILYLQRTPLYVRNDAIVHPGAMLPLTGFDSVGNLTLLRLSPATPTEDQLEQLNELLHHVRGDIRHDVRVGQHLTPPMALNWLGTVSYVVDDWKLLNQLREAFGFLLPGAYEIAPRVDAMVEQFIAVLPDSDFIRVTFAAGPTAARPQMAPEEVAAPKEADRKYFLALIEEGIAAGEAGEKERALRTFRQCLEVDPESGVACFLVGQELIDLDQLEEGLVYMYKAQAIGGCDPAEVRRKLILGHFNLGARHFTARQFGEAIPHYRRAYELDHTDLEAQRRLMEALAYGGQLDEAFRHAAILLRDHGDDADVRLSVAAVYQAAGKSGEALAHADEALRLRPGWQTARRLRTELLPAVKSGIETEP